MKSKTSITLIVLALAASASTGPAQTLVWSDTEFIVGPTEWNTDGFLGILNSVNGQLIITENFFGRMQSNNPTATHVPAVHTVPSLGPLLDGQTIELRADLISASQSDAFASLAFNDGLGNGYMFNKNEEGLSFMKFYDGATKFAWFFSMNQPIKNENVTLVLALTRAGTNLNITTRVLDKDNGNSVLFDRLITDTPKADPVLPSYTAGGMIGMADTAGSPWPLFMGPTWIQLNLTWGDSQQAPSPRAQVIYDDLELWQYESPQLNIQNAVVLSWPVTQEPFVLESTDNPNGPWTPVATPWCRTNAGRTEASICAPDSRKFFRLRLGP